MIDYFYVTPSWLKGYQKNINDVFTDAPDDALWGCIKSAGASHAVTMLLTKGNIVSGTFASPIGVIATVIHTIVITVAKHLKGNISQQQWWYVPRVATVSGIIGSYYVGKKMGIKSNFWASLIATALLYPFSLKQINTSDPKTPLFLTVIV
jgi:hypothetical protein